jgi:hypothetical protein
MELSYRWRQRALLTSTLCFINSSWSSRRPAVSWSDWLGPRFLIEGDRHLYIRSTARLESPPLEAINSLDVEYRKAGALGDRNRHDPSSFHIDVADKQAFAFGSLAIWQRRIFRWWRIDGQAFRFGLRKCQCHEQCKQKCPHSPNETKLSHRWRERSFATSTTVS